MTTRHDSSLHGTAPPSPVSAVRGFAEWLVGIFAAVAVFMGAFILLGEDDHSVGFWGDASWEVGEISAWWGFGLIVGGVIALALVFTSVWQRRT